MTIAPSDRIISKYQARKLLFRVAYALVFLAVLTGSVLWIIYQLNYPDFYVRAHRSRYEVLIILGILTAFYILSRVFNDGRVIFGLLNRGEHALALRDGKIVSTNSSKTPIDIADIKSISLEPFQRAFGRPERLRVTTRTGLVRYIRCDILDRSGTELVREISELAHLPAPVGDVSP